MIIDINTKKSEGQVEQGSLKAWFLAARPKTLSGAAVPVMLGCACAYHAQPSLFHTLPLLQGRAGVGLSPLIPLILCFLFAFVMQIDANFINDYYDCVRGRDNEERLGPLRACQQGWISLRQMRWGIIITTIIACLVGLPLAYLGGYELILIGAACVLFCFLYTTTLSALGMGDLLVLIFFGIIPVYFTYYVLIHPATFSWSVLLTGIACGLVVDTLLLINNYRDIDNDRNSGKKTLTVFIGKEKTEWLYITLPTAALVMMLLVYGWTNMNIIFCFIPYFLFVQSWSKMRQIGQGRALNKVLGMTARNIFVYGLLISLLIILT